MALSISYFLQSVIFFQHKFWAHWCILPILAWFPKFGCGRNLALAFVVIHKQPTPGQHINLELWHTSSSTLLHSYLCMMCWVDKCALHRGCPTIFKLSAPSSNLLSCFYELAVNFVWTAHFTHWNWITLWTFLWDQVSEGVAILHQVISWTAADWFLCCLLLVISTTSSVSEK